MKCSNCGGRGTVTCPVCRGTGRVGGSVFSSSHECGHCGGNGTKLCDSCGGKGYT